MSESEEVSMSVEYRIKEVKRYIVTRCYNITGPGQSSGGVEERGEFQNADIAWEVGYALCKAEHERLGYPVDDERIQYPRHPSSSIASPNVS